MISDSFFLAVKNLRHRGVRSWLTLLGIFIGVTAVVALISLGNGLQLAVSSQFGVSQTELITIQASGVEGFGPPGSGAIEPLDKDDFEAVKRVSSVKRVAYRNIASGKLEYNNKIIFGYFASIPPGEERKFIYEQLDSEAVAGRLLKDSDSKKVFLGYNFYLPGNEFGKQIIPGSRVLIQDVEFQVVGILDKKGSFIFDNAIYMNERDMEDLFSLEDEVDAILAQPISKDYMDIAVKDIEKALRKTRGVKEGEENFIVSTPEAALSSVNDILGGVQVFIVIVASISIFIGALGIVNTMTTSVWERKKEIGIMKAVGATNKHIFLQFFIEASLLGLLGGLAGVLFGSLIGFVGTIGINSFIGAELHPSIDFSLIFLTLLGCLIVGGLAGITPALNAAKQNPVEAIRS
jgi:putative ABC transport system permease protein